MKNKKHAGRKTVITEVVLGKLEEAFSLDATDCEACLHAGIHPDTLYEYQKKTPEFSERKKLLKEKHILKARTTIINNLTDVKIAMWYLERKRPKEFNPRYLTSNPIPEKSTLSDEDKKRVQEIAEAFGEDDGED